MSQRSAKVALVSLGCPKNTVDSESILGQCVSRGMTLTSDAHDAEVIVVNTCGFLEEANQESVRAILDAVAIKEEKPDTRVVVTGCLVSRYQGDLAGEIPEVDLWVGAGEGHRMGSLLQQVEAPNRRYFDDNTTLYQESDAPRVLSTRPHAAYLKIAEGCDNPCTFCIIPKLRGPFRSRQLDAIVAEARQLAAQGVQEITLVAQDTTLYGRDLTPRTSLAALLDHLNAVDGLVWIRILYAYPTLVNDALIEAMKRLDKVVPYLDIPVQHVSDGVLRAMKRAETGPRIDALFTRLRREIPGIALRTSLIVGFPGESDEDFQALLDFVEKHRPEHLSVFAYSREEGTEAAQLPDQLPVEVRQARRDQLEQVWQAIREEQLQGLIGQTVEVLVDGVSEETDLLLEGRMSTQAPEVDGKVWINDGWAEPGSIVRVLVEDVAGFDVVGGIRQI
ncbi:MAG: ribosomal protein S12 methylthiotransferase RimO [Proteobacteria bacterium CG1_02_64_396]|nr:MAG: ribosomal protein S12 methylthiotransferase RimO [Proteobacteria bacterium CG1_02_64_396]